MVDGRMSEWWVSGRVDGWVDEWMEGWLEGWVNDGFLDGWVDGRMDGWMLVLRLGECGQRPYIREKMHSALNL